jgi:tRNA G18 (ribose-2'-O)-methylase SpoU
VKEIAKTALGGEHSISWEYAKNFAKLIEKLKEEDFEVVAIEQDARAVDYKIFHAKNKTLIIVGNEIRGLSPSMRKHADHIVEIPMRGKKESLNVSVAFGVVLFRIFDKEHQT